MLNQFSRTQLLLGKEAMDRLKGARVAVFGIGGVGGYVCEALVRSGVGAIDLIDDDKVCLTNLNRQIIATRKTIGKYKTDVMEERIHDINPDVSVVTHRCFFLPENADEFPFEEYDYIVDAVDTVTAKIALVMKAQEKNVPIISSMVWCIWTEHRQPHMPESENFPEMTLNVHPVRELCCRQCWRKQRRQIRQHLSKSATVW